jgi:hypothetical protein
LIWANEQVFKKDIDALSHTHVDDQQAQISAERIVAATPDWFGYGRPGDSVKDLLMLFSSANQIFSDNSEPTGYAN